MLTEDYVSYETAKLLKEKGFDGICRTAYETITNEHAVEQSSISEWGKLGQVKRPTLQMAMKWLRKKYSLEIYPYHNNPTIYNSKWWFEIIKYPNSVAEYESGKDDEFDTYEEACEAAIKYCLENLI